MGSKSRLSGGAQRLRAALVAALLLAMSTPADATRYFDGVPLPADVARGESGIASPWTGAWVGAWGGDLKHILVVERVTAGGSADVIYAIGASPAYGIIPEWSRHKASISGDTLVITGNGFTARYERKAESIEAVYTRGAIRSTTRMSKVDGLLAEKPPRVVWTPAISELLATDLMEDGKPVRLETVFFRPPGTGPFPLAVINHGSTGNGTDPKQFRVTFSAYALALHLNARGYLVAFPQRRGRGKSEGLYDEGFTPDRRRYSDDPTVTFAGFDRALVDLHAAIRVLKMRPDVAPGRILLGGQSRGGILSVAYAGTYPEDVAGVLNFVGGWTNGRDKNAVLVNGLLFAKGSKFPHPTLWLYGSNDPFYDLAHTRNLHARFEAAGGRGQYVSFERPPGSGHYIINDDSLWRAHVDAYLSTLPR